MRAMRILPAMAASVLVTGVVACTDSAAEVGPARVSALPAGVTGLGAAVFLTAVPDERRTDLRGLLAVERFGDDLAGVQPVRRHVELALGDPAAPTVARGLAEDPRDAFLADGRVRDTDLPGRSFVREATTVRAGTAGDGMVLTRNTCLVVRADGQIRRPADGEVTCRPGEGGGIVWSDRAGLVGGVDLETGEPSPGVLTSGEPLAATRDGRYVYVLPAGGEQLSVVDTRTGRVVPTEVEKPRYDADHSVTTDGYVFTRLVDRVRRLSVLRPDGAIEDLMAPVGRVAFTPDGTRAVAAATIVDLRTGAKRPLSGYDGSSSPEGLTATDRHALITSPSWVWTVDLDTGRVQGAPAREDDVTALSEDGRAVAGPPGAEPALPLTNGRVLFRLDDRLVVAGADGSRVELATDADEKEEILNVLATPDGGHLLVTLRGPGGRSSAGPGSRLVVVGLDGAGEPVVLYREAELVSLGFTTG